MDMVYSAADYRVWCVLCPIVKTESVGERQKFHVLGECPPAPNIIICAATAIGIKLTCLEYHCGVRANVLRLLVTSKRTIHTKGVGARNQLLVHLPT